MRYKQRVLSLLLASLMVTFILNNASATSTQGQFAVHLVETLGLGKGVEQEQAIILLSSLSIKPGVLPTSKWEKDKPATDVFVAYIQASIQIILKKTAQDLNIPTPPTLDLHILELPPVPQTAIFQKEQVAGPNGTNPPQLPPPPPPELETENSIPQ